MGKRVVITGIGPVTALGVGKEIFFKNLFDMKSVSEFIPKNFEKTYKFKSRYYVPLPNINYENYGFYSKIKRDAPENAKLAILAAHLALEDARITIPDKNTSVIIGTGISNLEASHLAFDANKSGTKYNRMSIPSSMANAPAAWVSIVNNLHGDSYTINTACASSTYAIGEAFRKIQSGYTDTAISGGVEFFKDEIGTVMRGFDVLTTLTKSENGDPMPFSKCRSGFLFSEGAACCLILENYEKALERNATIYAEIINYQANCDAYNIVMMEPSGNNILQLLIDLIQNEKIDYYNAHGTGTLLNDGIEASLIQSIYGGKENQPYINSTKGILGHNVGASGAIEAAVCALAIKHGMIHGNKVTNPLDNINLPLETVYTSVNSAVSTSFGFGGHNAGLLFKKI